VDLHVENGRGDQAAIIYDSPVTDTIRNLYLFTELKEQVSICRGTGSQRGRQGRPGHIYMPMIPEAAFAMLACARLGAVHSVVFGGFAANELATRINDAKPKVIVSASCGIEVKKVIAYKPLLDEAIDLSSHKPESPVSFSAPPGPGPDD
jgi:propionyl-CoA synthetase